jgi:hypothetical protein
MPKNASEVTLVPENIFFLKILNFVQSFVEWKVSLVDGTSVRHETCLTIPSHKSLHATQEFKGVRSQDEPFSSS